jgi:small-conductance mechanosensitive channel
MVMSDDGILKTYGQLTIGILLFGTLAFMEKLFTGPLAFVTGVSDATLGQWIMAAFAFALTLLTVRVTKREIIQGWLGRRSGKQIPQLIGDMIGGMVLFTGICLILAVVFKRDITALVATGGASLMIVGIAVRDIILALFTGIVLNIEKPFKEGDTVRIGDKYWGKVIRITWRTTVLQTGNKETIFIPNISLANAVILNMALPDASSKRSIELVIDYDTSVESAERILYAAAIGAANVKHVGAPSVLARKMERDGVLYEISFTITDYADGTKSEHAVIKSILQCMRDAEITVSFPKSEVIQSQRRVSIANRSLDVFHLVQQCRLFRGLPDEVCHRISKVLVERHFVAGAPIIQAGERRYALFIVGEGMARRTLSNRDGSTLVQERFIATELFGRRSLFACQPQVATVLAESAVLLYELDRRALARLFEETPDLIDTLAQALSHLSWNESNAENPWLEPPTEVIERLVNLYQGQLEANYGERSVPTRSTSVTSLAKQA